MTNEQDLLFAKLNLDTAIIRWHELQRFFAQGKVLIVNSDQDLVTVAKHLAADSTKEINHLIKASMLSLVTDDEAREMIENDSQVWAVVVAPWVLIQKVSEARDR